MKYILMLIGCFWAFSCLSQENKIPIINAHISVDGELNEEVWKQLPEITGFYNYMPIDEGLAKHQTITKLFHDGEYLYLSAVYQDSEARIQTSSLKRDVSIGISDSFVLILDTQNQKQIGYYFAVNTYGTQVDGLVERVNEGFDFSLSWNARWKAAASVQGTDKVYEIAIPLKALNYDKNNPVFNIQMYVRDIKKNAWTIMTNVKRNYRLFDLRFTTPFLVESLPDNSNSRFVVTPSLTLNHQEEVVEKEEETSFKPSLDIQYNLTSSLKLDATVNPDFSQIDVDQQVTNLTRFALFFPERRNFFLENADLFSNLGVDGVNPFYSRRIGQTSEILFGTKLSGNLSPKTRIGLLNIQTDENQTTAAQNYGALVTEYQLSEEFTATGFIINRQQTDGPEFLGDYNRVAGVNLNYKSTNNRWTGITNLGKSFNDGVSGNNSFYNAQVWYNKRGFTWNLGLKGIGENYITDVGFTPRLYHFDALNGEVTREGYTQTTAELEYEKYYENSGNINSFRVLNYRNNNYFDNNGSLSQSSHFFNSALFFKDLSAIYYVVNYDYVDLKYGFAPLNNGNVLNPDVYRFGILKLGYNSANNQKLRYRVSAERGTYYGGRRSRASLFLNYQLLPFANFQLDYDVNTIDLDELGKETFHLTRFTGEVFFNRRLNWSTYVQYNTQRNNFNVNSRIQWEYKPLSYIYLVVTDNFNRHISRTNWGIAFKINYRLDF